ncbi:hypothetical protein HK104_002136 [Borealophlyctis nickersoniae]|nr:hypothetical protein HK104_002136 [Borealophlyctis nickersoniae]
MVDVQTYKAYTIHYGKGFDDLTLTYPELPKPTKYEVLVKVKAVSLNYRDIAIAEGTYPMDVKEPLIPCSDCCGQVISVGDGVTRVKEGDRVCGTFFQNWTGGEIELEHTKTALGGAVDGVLAEYKLFMEEGLVKCPEHLTDEEAATLPCAAVTAWNALMTPPGIKSGDNVLCLGTGGVSTFALLLARANGAQVIQTSSSDEKLKHISTLGATHTINYKHHPAWDKQVRKLTNDRGVDHVIEVGGGATLPLSIRAARFNGIINNVGWILAGPTATTAGEIMKMVLATHVTIRGIYVGSRQDFEAMNRCIEFHKIKPVVHKVFNFDEAPEAYKYQKSQKHIGKVVIRVSN